MLRRIFMAFAGLWLACSGVSAHGQNNQVVLARENSTIALEPYAQNIIRVTLSLQKDQATAAPGFEFVGHENRKALDQW